MPRGLALQVELPDGPSRGYICENYGADVPAAGARPARRQRSRQSRAISSAPVAAFEDKEAPCSLVAKFQGNLWAAEMKHSPLNVVAWHGNFAPYKYDLARFMVIGTISFDHPDPSIFTRADRAVRHARHRQRRLRDLPAALAGRRGHVPPALVPPQRDDASSWGWCTASTTPRPKASCRAARACTTACRRTAPTPRPGSARPSAELKPHKIDDTMAFMFETPLCHAAHALRHGIRRSCSTTTSKAGRG